MQPGKRKGNTTRRPAHTESALGYRLLQKGQQPTSGPRLAALEERVKVLEESMRLAVIHIEELQGHDRWREQPVRGDRHGRSHLDDYLDN